jgi:hypothetical protein
MKRREEKEGENEGGRGDNRKRGKTKCRSQFYKLTPVVRPHIFSCTI